MSRTSHLRPLALLMSLALAASVLAVLASPARAANFTVTNISDSGAGSLRQAIIDANQNTGVADTIFFDQSLSGQTITLSSQLTVTDSAELTVDVGGADITVSGNTAVRVFFVDSGAKLTLNRLGVANGYAPEGSFGVGSSDALGGGIYNAGTLTVSNSTLSHNIDSFSGGGIYNTGTLTVSNSTLSKNIAGESAGGGISNTGTLTVRNSTLSKNNSEGESGGGIYNEGTLTVSNSTLSENDNNIFNNNIFNRGSATVSHSTLYEVGSATNMASLEGTLTVSNTIVASNGPAKDCFVLFSGTIIDGGYNLSSDGSCGFSTANNSLPNTDPKLGELAFNGGPTQTHALLEDSPAVDKGNSSAATADDQRGEKRPSDFPEIANAGDGSDIGAFELQTPTEQITDLKDDVTDLNLPAGIDTSLQAKLDDALAAIGAGDKAAACTALGDFINQVNAQAGKKISQSDVDGLITSATRIRTVLGCQ